MIRRLPPLQARITGLLLPVICALSAIVGILVYQSLYDAILHRFEMKLATTSGMIGAFVDPTDHGLLTGAIGEPGFSGPAAENTGPYIREIAPMRAVRRELDLTYLYTQVTSGPTKVRYVLDGTEGEEHTTVGHEDELPADTMEGLRGVEAHGRIYISPIQQQEAWGLLKTAAAPLWSPDGRIAGSVGADVNIGIIRQSTENALLICGLIGGISMVLAAASVSLVVNLVARPLAAVKLATLKLAAGGFRLELARHRLAEIDAIGRDLTSLAAGLEHAAAERASADRAMLIAVHDREVARSLGEEPEPVILREFSHIRVVAFKPCFAVPADGALWRHGLEAITAAGSASDPAKLIGLLETLGGRFALLDRRSAVVTAVGGPLWIDNGDTGSWLTVGPGQTGGFDPARSLRVGDGTHAITVPPDRETTPVAK